MPRLRHALPAAILLSIAACTAGMWEGTAVNTLENSLRAGCKAAHNCTNTCADGSTARGPANRCGASTE